MEDNKGAPEHRIKNKLGPDALQSKVAQNGA
jgi:hypothetical protein